jgi:hypothetical protein
MTYKQIANLIPTLQAVSLANENLKVVTKKKKTKDIVDLGVKNIVGVSLLKVNADLIGEL